MVAGPAAGPSSQPAAEKDLAAAAVWLLAFAAMPAAAAARHRSLPPPLALLADVAASAALLARGWSPRHQLHTAAACCAGGSLDAAAPAGAYSEGSPSCPRGPSSCSGNGCGSPAGRCHTPACAPRRQAQSTTRMPGSLTQLAPSPPPPICCRLCAAYHQPHTRPVPAVLALPPPSSHR